MIKFTLRRKKKIKSSDGGNIQNQPNNAKIVLCEASKLSLEDEFMKYKPRTNNEKVFKIRLEEAIKSGVKDFYRPNCDPSLDADEKICYVTGAVPAVGKTFEWWEENAKKFSVERKSRLGTKNEYIAFLGVLIKELSMTGLSIENAWDVVCNHSEKIAHYGNSEERKRGFEKTGSRELVGFYDLANTFKMLARDENYGGFWTASGAYYCNSDEATLSIILKYHNCNCKENYSVGWIVLEE